MVAWIATGRDGTGVTAYALEDGEVLRRARGIDEPAALTQLDFEAGRMIRIGAGEPRPLPAPVLPESGPHVPAFTQAAPPGRVDAWVRLWIAGFLADRPGWHGVICAVADRVSHWIQISAEEAVSTQGFLTPHLIGALGGAAPPDTEAVADSLAQPERLAAQLRTAEVADRPAAVTGHLLGAELAAARPYWLGQQVALIAPEGDPTGHEAALRAQGVPAERHAPDSVLPAGLAALGHRVGLIP